jgi:hypothetical protein
VLVLRVLILIVVSRRLHQFPANRLQLGRPVRIILSPKLTRRLPSQFHIGLDWHGQQQDFHHIVRHGCQVPNGNSNECSAQGIQLLFAIVAVIVVVVVVGRSVLLSPTAVVVIIIIIIIIIIIVRSSLPSSGRSCRRIIIHLEECRGRASILLPYLLL